MKIQQQIHDLIIEHARRDAPIEACGYLAACDGEVCKHFPMTNTDTAAEHYTLDPTEQFAVVREARSQGLVICAVYHSHPVTPARPSEEDIRLAYDPDMSYVIVSLADNRETVKSFRIQGGIVEQEEIEIIS